MARGMREAFRFYIPDYNFLSLINTVTRILNMERRGLLTTDAAIDEIVRAYQDHSVV